MCTVKPKQSLWPITTEENETGNQSELEANTRSQRKVRENAGGQVTIAFSLASGLRNWREFFKPIREPQMHISFDTDSIENRSISSQTWGFVFATTGMQKQIGLHQEHITPEPLTVLIYDNSIVTPDLELFLESFSREKNSVYIRGQ